MAKQEVIDGDVETGEELTRGHKKKARTRQLLVEAALRIYSRMGVGDLTLQELAAEAGVSHGTIYNYFRTREEVLEAVGIALAQQMSEQVLVISAGVNCGAERLAIGARAFILRTIGDPEWASALIRVTRYSQGMRDGLSTYIRTDLRMGLEQGDFKYVNEDIAMELVLSVVTGAISSIADGLVVEHHELIVTEMLLLALGVSPRRAHRIANMTVTPAVEVLEPPATPKRGAVKTKA